VGKRRYRSRVATAAARSSHGVTLVLRFRRRDLGAIRRALRHHRLTAAVTVTFTDRSKRAVKRTLTIRLRR
jgi:hypothetical protein